MNIYVGNLSRETAEQDLRTAFEAFGQVSTASIIKDKFSGESRGFGFVEMPTGAEAQAAIAGMGGKELKGRILTVNEARPRTDRGGRGGGGGGGGRGGDRQGGGGGRRSW
ncbi:MAG: RNA-binding protein [Planctomycetota bacterium]|nr:RNA-binding protein [Planctomycetota bacterium]